MKTIVAVSAQIVLLLTVGTSVTGTNRAKMAVARDHVNALVRLDDGSTILVTAGSVGGKISLDSYPGARWSRSAKAVINFNEGVVSSYSPDAQKVRTAKNSYARWKKLTREDWTCVGLSDTGEWVALYDLSKPMLMLVDARRDRVVAEYDTKTLAKLSRLDIERQIVLPVGVAVTDDGAKVAIVLPSRLNAGGTADDPIGDSYVVDVSTGKLSHIGHGAPVAWTTNELLLCQRYDDVGSDEYVPRVIAYSRTGRIIWERPGYSAASYDGSNVVVSREELTANCRRRKFEISRLDGNTGKKLATVEIETDSTVSNIVALPSVLPKGW